MSCTWEYLGIRSSLMPNYLVLSWIGTGHIRPSKPMKLRQVQSRGSTNDLPAFHASLCSSKPKGSSWVLTPLISPYLIFLASCCVCAVSAALEWHNDSRRYHCQWLSDIVNVSVETSILLLRRDLSGTLTREQLLQGIAKEAKEQKVRSAAKCCKGMNYDETCENWVVEVVEGDHVWARCKRQNNLLRQPTAKQSGTAWNSLERSGTHFRSARVSKQACKGPMEPAEYRRRQARGLIERVINCDCMTDMTVRLSMKYCSITAWWNKNK